MEDRSESRSSRHFNTSGKRESRRVGEPIQELALIDAIARDAGKLFHVGPGRTARAIFEPEVGSGRPDAVLLSFSLPALERFKKTGLRIGNLSSARALTDQKNSTGLSAAYARTLRRGLIDEGWNPIEVERASRIVYSSLGIEAKVSDWRRAVQQATIFQKSVHRSAILMPGSAASRVDLPVIQRYDIGLAQDTPNGLKWIREPGRQEVSTSASLWMLELLVRAIDSGAAYKLSELRKFRSASSMLSTLGR